MLQEELTRRNYPFLTLNTQDYPYRSQITFDIEDTSSGFIRTPDCPEKVPLSAIRSTYYCVRYPFEPLPEDPPEIQFFVLHNIESAFWSFLHSLDCMIVNPVIPANHHEYKGHMLKLFRSRGIRVPDTVVTNDPEEVMRFYESQNRSVIYKPPYGQAFTEKLKDEDLAPEKLAKLSNSPILLQEYIPGQDYRVYVIKDEVFAVQVMSNTLDLNRDAEAQRVAVDIPDSVAEACVRVAEAAGLFFTGIDVRRTPEEEWVFFEANSSPDYTTDEYWTGYPLCARLADMLIAGE